MVVHGTLIAEWGDYDACILKREANRPHKSITQEDFCWPGEYCGSKSRVHPVLPRLLPIPLLIYIILYLIQPNFFDSLSLHLFHIRPPFSNSHFLCGSLPAFKYISHLSSSFLICYYWCHLWFLLCYSLCPLGFIPSLLIFRSRISMLCVLLPLSPFAISLQSSLADVKT